MGCLLSAVSQAEGSTIGGQPAIQQGRRLPMPGANIMKHVDMFLRMPTVAAGAGEVTLLG